VVDLMRLTVKLYATLSEYLPPGSKSNRVDIDLAEGTTVSAALQPFSLPARLTHLVLVNGTFIPTDERPLTALHDGDVLAVWPPIAGG